MKRSTPLTLCLVFIFCACAPRNVSPLGHTQSTYHAVLKRHLFTQRFFAVEKITYLTTAIYMSEELRRAFVDEYALKYRLTSAEKQSMLDKELADANQFTEFTLIHYASEPKTSKLSSDSKTWQLRLQTEASNDVIAPSRIDKLQGDLPILNYFYPNITQWSQNYRVKFPKASQARQLDLHMDGVEANVTYHWNL